MITIKMLVDDSTTKIAIEQAAYSLGCRVHEYDENNVLTFRPSENDEAPQLDAGTINGI